MNKVILLGRLTRDPETRYTAGEQLAVTRFGIAVQKRVRPNSGEPDADFFNCVSFGKTAENIAKFFKKGRRIAVSGRIQNNDWEDNNGVKHYSVDIIVEDFDFTESKAEAEGGSYGAGGSYSSGGSKPTAPESNMANDKVYDMPETEDDDDLPF